MKKLVIFFNIALLSLSLCAFIFGIYAANNVSVTSGGSISFIASGDKLNVNITRTVSGYDEELSTGIIKNYSQDISLTSQSFDTLKGEKFQFIDADTPIVMTFVITNNATDKNLDFIISDTNSEFINVTQTMICSANMYDTVNKKYNVNPYGTTNNSETITIKFFVNDPKQPASINYDYLFQLRAQNDISDLDIEESTLLSRVGNTFVLTNTLDSGNQLTTSVDGNSYHEYPSRISGANIESTFHVYGKDVTDISSTKEAIGSNYTIAKTSDGFAGIKATSASNVSTNVVLPTAVNTTTDGLMIISSISYTGFAQCSTLETIKIPASVNYIDAGAFWNCTKLSQINLPLGLSQISEHAFDYCIGLTEIELPHTITTIVSGAFWGCYYLTKINLPECIESIGKSAFSNTSITLNKLPPAIKEIDSYTFSGPNITITHLPLGLRTLAYYAFQNCTGITTITFPSSVNIIKVDESTYSSPFYNCTNLAEIIVDENHPIYTSTDANNMLIDTETNTLICGTKNVTEIPNTIQIIGDGAFRGFANLTLTSLPDSITEIGGSAFSSCTSLSLKSLPSGLTKIADSTFENCTSLALTSLPDSITEIGWWAFSGCTSLALTSLPSAITEIYEATFKNCTNLALESLPEGITTIGAYAFANCVNLKMYNNEQDVLTMFPKSLKTIYANAFSGCTGFMAVYFEEGLQFIESEAFKGCTNLAALVAIPESLNSFGQDAFASCPLGTVNYNGTNAQWDLISGTSEAGFPSGMIVWTDDGSIKY